MNPVGLHTLHPARGSRHRRTRVGRGSGSGKGTYSGRGIKGQRARTGGRSNAKYLGKRTPVFIYQLPKRRGFRSIHPSAAVVSLDVLEKAAPADG
ncbi:MAG: uL15 family ribosomal protein, partial [Candidatus Kerfeldbacteria bacterium]|nr:uL15 family ribosomal protein [Candidatus Kerfeldbacteria bacterium]